MKIDLKKDINKDHKKFPMTQSEPNKAEGAALK